MMERDYLAIVTYSNGTGTHWVETVTETTDNIPSVQATALQACANAWACDPNELHVLALIKKDLDVLYYNDSIYDPSGA